MQPTVEIAFDCLPLHNVGRLDVPLDATPAQTARAERIAEAVRKHGTENAYYLENAFCVYRLANSDIAGMLRFEVEGTILTDASDGKTAETDLNIHLVAETCDGVPEGALEWLQGQVTTAVQIEFERYLLDHRSPATSDELSQGAL